MKHPYFWGVVTGVVGTWVYHAFVRKLPAAKAGA